MPTILRILGFRFFFFSNEGNEPPHTHVEKAEAYAKYWLEPVELASSYAFKSMFKIHPLGCKLPIKEPDFTLFSPHSAAMRLKKAFRQNPF